MNTETAKRILEWWSKGADNVTYCGVVMGNGEKTERGDSIR